MNYIISGSCGLIGSKLKEKLDTGDNKCIMEVDTRKGSNILNINSVKLTKSTQKTDIFIHAGAHCKIAEGIEYPELPHMNNARGTYECLEFCRRNNIKKFVYLSSSRILSPEENPYTASKKYGEHLCEAYKQCYGIEFVIIRPSTVYGEHHDLTTRLLTKWIISAMKRESFYIYGLDDKTLDFTHVDDFVNGVMCLLSNWDEAKNDYYDICGNDCRKLIDVADLINEELIIQKYNTKRILCDLKPAEIAQPQHVKIDISKIKKFGYSPRIKLEEGIRRMIIFYKNEGKKWIN